MTRFTKTLALLGALLLGSTSLAISAKAGEHEGQQLYPLLSYRTGPYASSGIPQWAGIRDYITYVNDHGGVDGVKIFVQECETAYTLERGFECYERYKNGYDGAPVAILMGTSSGFDVAASEKIRADKVPLVTNAGGREDAVDGSVFPYQFPLLFDYWTEIVHRHRLHRQAAWGLRQAEGPEGRDRLPDSGYGRDTIEPLATLAKKYGFEDIEIPVPHPGEQQQAQWQQIKQAGVDWVFFRAWGVMTPVGIKTAARVGFPADHIIGDIWSGSEEDVRPAGAAANGLSRSFRVSVRHGLQGQPDPQERCARCRQGRSQGPVEVRLGLLQRRRRDGDHLHRGTAGRTQEVRQPSANLGAGSVGARAPRHHARSGSRKSARPVCSARSR